MKLAAALLAVCWGWSAAAVVADPVDYAGQIKPLLKHRCYSCHGALKQQSGLRLDTAALARQGGDSGPVLAAGDAAASRLIARVSATDLAERMPPEGDPLSAEEIALLAAWIDQGAVGPADELPEPDPASHWAFRPPLRADVPQVDWTTRQAVESESPDRQVGPATNPIDAFLAVGHQVHGLSASPPADKLALLRRVYLDLIGLPPTREELHAFLADPAEDAYERVVDRLLASPHHGERWARHWMDVWRYSDWYGRRAVPDVWNSAPQVWRWRDWIVQSLNEDKGYDRMVQEMLAADELAPEDERAAPATGYLVRNWYALNPNQWMKDNVEHTGKAFLGLTFNCCLCHDHKYDPISQEEYFRFRAFFEPLGLRQDRVRGEPDPGPFQKYDYLAIRKEVKEGIIRVLDERPAAETWMYVLGDERNRMAGKPPVPPGAPAFLAGDQLPIQPVAMPLGIYYPNLQPWAREALIADTHARVEQAQTALDAAEQVLEQFLHPTDGTNPTRAEVVLAELAAAQARQALAVAQSSQAALAARLAADAARYTRPDDPDLSTLAQAAGRADRALVLATAEENWLQARQQLFAAQAAIKPDDTTMTDTVTAAEAKLAEALAAVEAARAALDNGSPEYRPVGEVFPQASTGRRLALARWIANRDNPLTARVAVNHLWLRHFGRPLVASVFDFGRNGAKSTHPELLDWLAVELMENGWGMKRLHRLIVTSAAYRMQSTAGDAAAANLASDPDNRWLWKFPSRRLEAEAVRDSLLHATGQLDLAQGGPPLDNSLEDTSRRRSLYFSIYPEGGGQLKFAELFDAPDPCDCYRRTETIMPQQALALTNSRLPLDLGRLLARRLWDDVAATTSAGEDRETAFITAAFEQVLTRPPTDQEQAVCRHFLGKQRELFRTVDAAAATPATEGQIAPSPDPQIRACESLVQALFSHNDFVTMR